MSFNSCPYFLRRCKHDYKCKTREFTKKPQQSKKPTQSKKSSSPANPVNGLNAPPRVGLRIRPRSLTSESTKLVHLRLRAWTSESNSKIDYARAVRNRLRFARWTRDARGLETLVDSSIDYTRGLQNRLHSWTWDARGVRTRLHSRTSDVE